MNNMAVFPRVLGDRFEQLSAPLQVLHAGTTMDYAGTASVRRGTGALTQLACLIAGLPLSVNATPVRVQLEVIGATERWTRWFHGARPMRSQLWAQDGCLRERLGPAVTDFALEVRAGALHWTALRMWVLGIPIPRRCFDMQARVSASGSRYRFEIMARLALIGDLITYEGELDVDA
jgi:hypothetical protein